MSADIYLDIVDIIYNCRYYQIFRYLPRYCRYYLQYLGILSTIVDIIRYLDIYLDIVDIIYNI